jgi:hypothetical protein
MPLADLTQGRSSSACLALPCLARPPAGRLAAPILSRRTGAPKPSATGRGPEPAGTRWVHAEPAGGGVQRARAVTSGSEEPQVKPLTPATTWQHWKRRARVRVSHPVTAVVWGVTIKAS